MGRERIAEGESRARPGLRPPPLVVHGALALAAVLALNALAGRFVHVFTLVDLSLFCLSLHVLLVRRRRAGWLGPESLLVGAYAAAGLVPYLLGDGALGDYVLIYKAFLYLLLLGSFDGAGLVRRSDVRLFTQGLILLFLITYLWQRLALGEARPGLLSENNYELVFLILAFLVAHAPDRRPPWAWSALLVAVLALSGSRSALFSGICIVLLLHRPGREAGLVAPLVLLPALALLFHAVFQARMLDGGVLAIDRLVFLSLFRRETADWDLWRHLLGAPGLTLLSTETCIRLSFYETLVSDRDAARCYSVIFHSFLLRAVFDHGLFGLALLFAALLAKLVRGGASAVEIAGCLLLAALNGLSVSSLNSGFFIGGVALLLSVRRPARAIWTLRPEPGRLRHDAA